MKNLTKFAAIMVVVAGVFAYNNEVRAEDANQNVKKTSTQFFKQIEDKNWGDKKVNRTAYTTSSEEKAYVWDTILHGEKEQSQKLKKDLNKLMKKLEENGLTEEIKDWQYAEIKAKSTKFKK